MLNLSCRDSFDKSHVLTSKEMSRFKIHIYELSQTVASILFLTKHSSSLTVQFNSKTASVFTHGIFFVTF